MNKKFLLMFTAMSLTLSSFSALAMENKPLLSMEEKHHIENIEKRMPPKPEEMEAKLADKLKLDDAQRVQAKKIREEGRKKVKPLMKEMKEIREKMDKLRQENMEEFEKILTPEQKNKFSELKKEMKEKHHKGRKLRGHRGEHRKFEIENKK